MNLKFQRNLKHSERRVFLLSTITFISRLTLQKSGSFLYNQKAEPCNSYSRLFLNTDLLCSFSRHPKAFALICNHILLVESIYETAVYQKDGFYEINICMPDHILKRVCKSSLLSSQCCNRNATKQNNNKSLRISGTLPIHHQSTTEVILAIYFTAKGKRHPQSKGEPF